MACSPRSTPKAMASTGTNRFGHWPPAGPEWRSFSEPDVLGIAGATVQAKDPEAIALRWSHLLEASATGALRFDGAAGQVRSSPWTPDGTGFVGVEIAVRDPAAVLARAAAAAV